MQEKELLGLFVRDFLQRMIEKGKANLGFNGSSIEEDHNLTKVKIDEGKAILHFSKDVGETMQSIYVVSFSLDLINSESDEQVFISQGFYDKENV